MSVKDQTADTDKCTDVEAVIKSMLTERVPKSFLDSGSAYGYHDDENRKNPPWEKPKYQIRSEYVIKNVYHHLTEDAWLERSDRVVEQEQRFYDWAKSGEQENESWLTCMRQWADKGTGKTGPSINTYNNECEALTQCIQFVGFEDRTGTDYVLVQIHGGCDIRGGYTKPRLFEGHWRELVTGELSYHCPKCEWTEAESCLWDYDMGAIHNERTQTVRCPECGKFGVSVI